MTQEVNQEMDGLRQEVEALQNEREAMAAEIERTKRTAALTNALAAAGVTDMEVALLLTQQQAETGEAESFDAGRAVAAVKENRPWLFEAGAERTKQPAMTAGARTREHSGMPSLALLAEKARLTGSDKDLHAYMQARRRK